MRKNGTVVTLEDLEVDVQWIIDGQPLSMEISDICLVLKRNGWEVSRNTVFTALKELTYMKSIRWDVTPSGRWVFWSHEWVYWGGEPIRKGGANS